MATSLVIIRSSGNELWFKGLSCSELFPGHSRIHKNYFYRSFVKTIIKLIKNVFKIFKSGSFAYSRTLSLFICKHLQKLNKVLSKIKQNGSRLASQTNLKQSIEGNLSFPSLSRCILSFINIFSCHLLPRKHLSLSQLVHKKQSTQ